MQISLRLSRIRIKKSHNKLTRNHARKKSITKGQIKLVEHQGHKSRGPEGQPNSESCRRQMYGFLEHSCIPASYSLMINFPQLIDIEDSVAEERTDYRIEEKDVQLIQLMIRVK